MARPLWMEHGIACQSDQDVADRQRSNLGISGPPPNRTTRSSGSTIGVRRVKSGRIVIGRSSSAHVRGCVLWLDAASVAWHTNSRNLFESDAAAPAIRRLISATASSDR